MVETKWGELTRQLKFVQWDETYQVVIRIIIVIIIVIIIIRSNIYIYIYYFYPKEDDDISSEYYNNSLSFSWSLYDQSKTGNNNGNKSNCGISF